MILVRKNRAIFSLRAKGIINGHYTISTQLIDDQNPTVLAQAHTHTS